MPYKRPQGMIGCRLPNALCAQIKAMALSDGLTVSELVGQWMREKAAEHHLKVRQEFLVKSAAVAFTVTDTVSLPVVETVVRRPLPVTHVSQAYPIQSVEVRHGKEKG